MATGEPNQLRVRYPEAEVVGSDRFLMLPGMVNSHDHGRAVDPVMLGVPDDMLEAWLPQLAALPTIDPYLAAAYEGLRLLSSGVTAVAHSHIPRDWENLSAEAAATIRGYRDAGIRVAFHPPIVEQNLLVYDDVASLLASLPPQAQAQAQRFLAPPPLGRRDYFALCRSLLSTHATPGVHIQVSPAGGQWCSDELILEAVEFAKQHHIKVQMHLLETRYQRQYAYRRWGKSFVQHLAEIEALGPWLTCAHMVWVESEDIPLLARHQVGVAHNPSSNLRLRSGTAPIAAMHAVGIPIGIGLDGLSLDADQDFFREMCLAWTLGAAAGFPLDATAIWQLGTTGGAEITFGCNVPLGRLEPGAFADLVLINLDALDAYSPGADGLLRYVRRQQVDRVMVGGKWVVKEGQSCTLERKAVLRAIAAEIAAQGNSRQAQLGEIAACLRRFYAQWERRQ